MMTMLRSSAMIALITCTALSGCGGSDPPGGGNGETDGGETPGDGNNTTPGLDGHVPNPNNPLIAVIPGMWELIAADFDNDAQGWIELPPGDPNRTSGSVLVNPSDPGCTNGPPHDQPPGDACIRWGRSWSPTYLVLEGETVRYVEEGIRRYEGRVLDNGRLIEYHEEWYRQELCTDWDEERGVCRDLLVSRRFRKLD